MPLDYIYCYVIYQLPFSPEVFIHLWVERNRPSSKVNPSYYCIDGHQNFTVEKTDPNKHRLQTENVDDENGKNRKTILYILDFKFLNIHACICINKK